MSILETFGARFRREKEWVELDTLYSAQRKERLCAYLADRNIPYKMRAAFLPMNGAMMRPVWYLSVHPDDVGAVNHYQRGENNEP